MKSNNSHNTNVMLLANRRGFSVSEACEVVGVSPNFLKGQIRQGLLRARRLGRRVIILSEDLEAYLATAELVHAFDDKR